MASRRYLLTNLTRVGTTSHGVTSHGIIVPAAPCLRGFLFPAWPTAPTQHPLPPPPTIPLPRAPSPQGGGRTMKTARASVSNPGKKPILPERADQAAAVSMRKGSSPGEVLSLPRNVLWRCVALACDRPLRRLMVASRVLKQADGN
ncbi:hypothetical protein Vretifemale_390 [Volvox reticuliferus]|uniref:Uncharacterized protein n=1 Tax=Volvox reticuliferus TaxID=1737510 RepID=A0A8J4C1D3_9CHLO|nr:hypothetical protein Vretifemale_390 [Volvox reticuliferus]